jgi:glycosyltransferase involved in cell wall biosynthesis
MHSSLPHQLKAFHFADYWPVIKLFELLERSVLNTCDAVITVGPALETYVHQINPDLKLATIENLPLQLNGTAPVQSTVESLRERWGLHNKQLIVYTGTFEPYQDLELLLASVQIVREQNPDVSLVLAGGTPEQIIQLQTKTKELGVEQFVVFPGSVSPGEAIVYLDLATILVSPRKDGTSVPLKLYSYLYSGRPIVATDLATHRQLLNEEIAMLVAPTSKAFAEAISALLRYPDRRDALAEQALKFAQARFNPATYLANLGQLYNQLESGGSDRKKNASIPLRQEN